eukprot:UN03009
MWQEENAKKAKALREAEVDPASLRGHAFFGREIYDPEFTDYQCSLRDRYPDYYLSPPDEFVYQNISRKTKRGSCKESLHTEAVEFLKQWKDAETK